MFRTSIARVLTAMVLGAVAMLTPVAFAGTAHADGCYTWSGTLREGSSGEGVTRLQIRIAGWVTSGEVLAVDGRFGPATTRALKRFQSAYGLTSDGVAGSGTFSKIYSLQDNDCTPIHFSYAEATENCGRGGFSGGAVSAATVKENLLRAMWKAEALRHKLGDHPIRVTSGFRDRACNASSGGASDSRHLYGDALDLVGTSDSLCTIAKAARSAGFNGIFGPGYPGHSDHTHVDSRPGGQVWKRVAMRNLTMTRPLRAVLRLVTVVVAAAALGVGLLSSPALAFSQASYPVQSDGNRGVDVQALQYLLQAHGISVTADGVFGSGTEAAVKTFQGRNNLTRDGIVGPKTWDALVVTVRRSSSGPAVRALQAELNKKRRLSLAVDGQFGSGTESAVRTFQSHAGITSDGVVGPATWRNLVWHYAYPSFAGMCDQNPDGNGTANWGTGSSIGQLEAAVAAFGSGNGRVPIGDISLEHGGDIPGHESHERGVDVDVWPIRTDSAQCTAGRITWRSSTYDRAATRALIKAVRAAAPGHIATIYFNDPTLINEGLTVQYPNHDNHFHVRYR